MRYVASTRSNSSCLSPGSTEQQCVLPQALGCIRPRAKGGLWDAELACLARAEHRHWTAGWGEDCVIRRVDQPCGIDGKIECGWSAHVLHGGRVEGVGFLRLPRHY